LQVKHSETRCRRQRAPRGHENWLAVGLEPRAKCPAKNFVLVRKMFYPFGMSHALNGHGNGNGHHVADLLRPPPKPAVPTDKQDGVAFRTADGVALRGVLVRMTRFAVFFELHNPSSVPQTSEVLTEFEIIFQGRIIYSGHAVIRGLVSTGVTVVCEATMAEESWAAMSSPASPHQQKLLLDEFKAFLSGWQAVCKILPEFKIVVADMQAFLTDARLWLEKAEIATRHLPAAEQLKWQHELVRQLQPTIVAAIANLFERFEEVSCRIDGDHVAAHHAFGKRLVQPILMASPFVHRTLTKPLGYAGDYEMVNMMFRDPLQGQSLFAKMVNLYALQLPPIIAHRNRIEYLVRKLEAESLRGAAQNRDLKVFNMGCGPAVEVQRFLAGSVLSHRAQFTLVDFSDETLAYTTGVLNELKQQHSRHTVIQPVKKSVNMLIKSAARHDGANQYDLIYCAGLFDYLTDQVCQQLLGIFYTMLTPGGLLVATNVDDHPAQNQMECFLEWHLIHRSNDDMKTLAPCAAAPQNISIKRDATGVNLFLEVRKPEREQ
jgi:extracellular factor (EF) 3-hydroxypalmitic acid methyl ester biosynthesis protein